MAVAPTILIVDGNAILHRAYHALPPLTAPDGRVVHAAYGFLTVLFKALADLQPTHAAVTFDREEETFRKRLFPAYQAQREEQPDDLYAQIPMIKDVLTALRIPVYEAAGFEADDVIGTIAAKCSTSARVIVVSGDKDLLQLVGDGVEVILLRRGMTDTARYDAAAVVERFGFPPERVPDFKALAGDPSDNYPGVPGVGEKTATELVKAFGGAQDIMAHAQQEVADAAYQKPLTAKLAKKLCDHTKDVQLGLTLATIKRDVAVAFRIEDCARRAYDREAAIAAIRKLGFTSLIARLPSLTHTPLTEKYERDFHPSPGEGGRGGVGITEVLTDSAALRSAISAARATGAVAVVGIARGDDVRSGHPLALGLACGRRSFGMMPWGTALAECSALLRDARVPKDTHGAKALLRLLGRSRMELLGLRDDTELMSYLLAPGNRSHDLAHVVLAELGEEIATTAIPEDPNTERRAAAERAAREASLIARVAPLLRTKLNDAGLARVYSDIELPLIPVLARMEATGILLDTDHLATLARTMRKELTAADEEIVRLAGHAFNVDSPAQLKAVLFEELGLGVRGIKKTAKGGTLSTAASELEKLRGAHPIIEHLFTHRELGKLLSTYVEALPKLVDSMTGRLHTTFHQTVTATGRLSSSDPNLQNIPVTEPWGPAIRSAFVAEKGWRLLALDYSQFELRVAATLSGDRALTRAFQSGADIHAATGAAVFHVPPEEVTRDQRRVAKAINFGILYGMGASALAQSAGISRDAAEEYIAAYFQTYAGLKEWIDATKALARSRGYVETLFGRKRFLPEIVSGVPQVRAAAERMAVNMPIQGTQADILKLAMIRADAWIRDGRTDRIRMLLTVHDELVFEVRGDCIGDAAAALRDILERVHPLAVPVIVEAKVGRNWGIMERV